MNATCRPFSIASSAASSATIVLPEPTSPCSSRFIGCGFCMVLDDVLQRLALAAREVKREHASQRLANSIVHLDREALALGIALPPSQQQADLKAKEFLQDQSTLCRRPEAVEKRERLVGLREVRRDERSAAIREPQCGAHVGRQRLGQIVGKPGQRVGHQLPLHLRRDRPRAFVDRDDAARVQRFDLVAVDDLELRVGDLQSRPLVAFERARTRPSGCAA